ncbi:MAG: hypothetical protein ACWGN1_02180 [Desulfobulbales bacterium]
MSKTAIDLAIKNIASGVEGMGQVHSRFRYSRSGAKLLTLLRGDATQNDPVNGLMFTRKAVSERTETISGAIGGVSGQNVRLHRYEFVWVFRLVDEEDTETVFQDYIENFIAAFAAEPTLDGACRSIYGPDGAYGIQVVEIGVDDFDMDTLHHTASMVLYVEEAISR